MKRKSRITALVLCLAVLCTLLGACQNQDNTTSTTTAPASTAPKATTAPASTPVVTEEPVADVRTLPLDETLKIKYWIPFDTKLTAAYNSFNEVELFNYIEELLNVDFEFIEPPPTMIAEQFGLMLASRDWPDLINSFERYYTGGAQGGGAGAIQGYADGVIIDIAEYVTEENMPNLSRFFAEFPEYAVMSVTIEGNRLTVPNYRTTESLFSTGWIVRQDILDENGWAHPETIAEMDELLYNMKDVGVGIPLMMGSLNATIGIPSIAPSWNMRSAYEYQVYDTHEVRFGAAQPEYKEMLDILRKWYADGILDTDFISNTTQICNAKIAEGKAGIWFGAGTADGINPWNAVLEAEPDSKMVLYGIPDLKVNKNDVVTPELAYATAANYVANNSACITTQCEDPSTLLFVLDWIGYSNDGIALINYGIEGEHWVYDADGKINRFVDVNGTAVPRVDADPSVPQWKRLANGEMTVWVGNSAGPYISTLVDYENHKLGVDVIERWFAPDDNSLDTIMAKNNITRITEWTPNWAFSNHSYNIPGIQYTPEQTAVRSEHYNGLKTYIEEYSASYILGTIETDTFDTFVDNLYSTMNLQLVIDAIQGAVDEYYSR